MEFDPGKETPVPIDGKVWVIGRLNRTALFAFRDWVKAEVGDPFADVIALKGILTPEDLLSRVVAAEAVANDIRQFSLATATAKRFLNTEGGMSQLLFHLLQTKHPEATPDDAFRVLLAMGQEDAAKALAAAQGSVPGPNAPGPATAA